MTERSGALKSHIVIVGGGFGGLNAARALKDAPVRVTLVDRRNHHVFQPLLYQVATAALSPADIASPIRGILRSQNNLRVLLGEVVRVDAVSNDIVLEDGSTIGYDALILAAGARHAYFGHEEWAADAPGLKSLEDALEIRRRILIAYEAAERTTHPAERDRLLTFVVVGGGPTGAELAGALAEIARYSLARDFRSFDPRDARIYLVEAGPRILSGFPEKLSNKAAEYLRRLGVDVRTGAMVTNVDDTGVDLKGGERIPAGTVLWAAGVLAAPVAKSIGVELDRAGRVPVAPDLSVPGFPNVFVVGDLAAVSGRDGKPLPGVAQVAMQGGRAAAANALRRMRGEQTEPFVYKDKGNMATIGRNRAIADIGRLEFGGFLAWAAWLLIHILNLIGFRNRLVVMTQWIWSYFTFQRGARLITSRGGDD